jgi:hypothetical protein
MNTNEINRSVNPNQSFYEYEFNGKKVIFHHSSKILVEVGKGKRSYTASHSFNAKDFGKAVMNYNMINIGNGYKKRLICHSLNKSLLARQFS